MGRLVNVCLLSSTNELAKLELMGKEAKARSIVLSMIVKTKTKISKVSISRKKDLIEAMIVR